MYNLMFDILHLLYGSSDLIRSQIFILFNSLCIALLPLIGVISTSQIRVALSSMTHTRSVECCSSAITIILNP